MFKKPDVFSHTSKIESYTKSSASVLNWNEAGIGLPTESELASHGAIARSSARSARNVPNAEIICSRLDCFRSFCRRSDLMRHINTKHMIVTKFCCPVSGCKRSREQSFTRKDKRDDHVRRTHGIYTDTTKPQNTSIVNSREKQRLIQDVLMVVSPPAGRYFAYKPSTRR